MHVVGIVVAKARGDGESDNGVRCALGVDR
jgi:hypothetical protein